MLGPLPRLREFSVARQGSDPLYLLQVPHPTVSDAAGDEGAHGGIAPRNPTSGGDSVGLVVEPLGEHGREFREQTLLHEIAVEGGDPVDRIAADDREVGHANGSHRALVDDGHTADAPVVAGETRPRVVEEAAVDFVNNLKMARKQMSHEIHRPLLQGLGQDGVVGVRHGLSGDGPRLVPRKLVLVQKEAHELRDGQGRMGVVELEHRLLVQILHGVMVLEMPPKGVL